MAGVFSRLRSLAMVSSTLGRLGGFCSHEAMNGPSSLPKQRFSVTAAAEKPASKPPSAYNLFQKDPKAKEGLTGLSLTELSQKLSGRWKSLNQTEKQRYETQAEVLKAEFEKLHGLAKKKKTASGKPISGYARYVKENFGDAKKGMPKASTPEVMKELAKQWSGLSESQKGKYKAG